MVQTGDEKAGVGATIGGGTIIVATQARCSTRVECGGCGGCGGGDDKATDAAVPPHHPSFSPPKFSTPCSRDTGYPSSAVARVVAY